MKLVAMLRIKNQILTIRECLSKLSEVVDEIVVVDNGSTDGTYQAYKDYLKVVNIKKTKGFDEGRDKCLAHKLAKSRNPDWILWVDGDEIFEKTLTRKVLNSYINRDGLNQVNFRMYHFWFDKQHYRVDGLWGKNTAFPQRQMWRNIPEANFLDIPFHNGGIKDVPEKHITSIYRIKHYGYIDKQQIKSRNKTYKAMEDDKKANKTLPTATTNMKRRKWLESDNPTINSLYQNFEYAKWQVQQNYLLYLDLLKKKFN